MKLTLHNRTDQHATLHFTWPDGRPGVCNVAARGERAISADAGAVSVILDHLSRYGVVEAAGIDRYDAARNPLAPPWKGVVYRLDGAP